MREVVETIAVYPVQAAPDGPLDQIREGLEAVGFSVGAGDEVDLAARRGLDRVFVGVAPHPDGLVARWKAKSLMPGRTHRIHEVAGGIVARVLGEPVRTLDPSEGSG